MISQSLYRRLGPGDWRGNPGGKGHETTESIRDGQTSGRPHAKVIPRRGIITRPVASEKRAPSEMGRQARPKGIIIYSRPVLALGAPYRGPLVVFLVLRGIDYSSSRAGCAFLRAAVHSLSLGDPIVRRDTLLA